MTADGAHLEGTADYAYDGNMECCSLKVMIILPTSQRQLIQNNKCPDAYPPNLSFYRKIEITYSVKAPDNTTITFNGTKEVSLSGTWERTRISYILRITDRCQRMDLN